MKAKVYSNYDKKDTFLTVDKNGHTTKKAYDNACKRVDLIDGDYLRLYDTIPLDNGGVCIDVVVGDRHDPIAIVS
jgi:hypothetical protein